MSLAIEDGNDVIIVSDDVEYRIPREVYDYVKAVMDKGVPLEDVNPVIRPSDIIGYLEEVNPEAQNVVVEREVAVAQRQANKQNIQILAIGATLFMLLIGLGALYILVSGSSGGTGGVVSAASGAFGIS